MPWPDRGLEIRRLSGLMEFMGAPALGEHLEWPLMAGDRESWDALPESRELAGRGYVCLHAGAIGRPALARREIRGGRQSVSASARFADRLNGHRQ